MKAFSIPLPAAFILSHLQGVVVLIVKGKGFWDLALNQKIEKALRSLPFHDDEERKNLIHTHVTLNRKNSFFYGQGLQTAENLAKLFMMGTANQGYYQDMKSLLINTGPHGSFTGLRLGCAFGNGLLALGTADILCYGIRTLPCDGKDRLNVKILLSLLQPLFGKTNTIERIHNFEPHYAALPRITGQERSP